jgi:hypothetical protein
MVSSPISFLSTIYELYKNKGVEALYLWGSVTTTDYKEGTSDIDCIAIVSDTTNTLIEKEIYSIFKNEFPAIAFDFHLLYRSELDGGSSKTFLTSVVEVELLLFDFSHWKHLAGHTFKSSDFLAHQPTIQEAIALQIKKIKNFNWILVEEISQEKFVYFLKTLSRILYLREKEQSGTMTAFSYSNLVSIQNKPDISIAKIILESRKKGWCIPSKESREILQQFIDTLLR